MSVAPGSIGVILPAAGKSARYGGGRSKLLELLEGRPVIGHAVSAFVGRPEVAEIVLAASDIQPLKGAMEPLDGRVRFVAGGESRAHSVWNALRALGEGIEWVYVHDAARPLLSGVLIDRTLMAAREHGAAVPALPVELTIKQATGPLPARVERTVPRQSLFAMQTPQVMRRLDLLRAFESCPIPLDQVTDDVQLLELAGQEVWLVEGERRNLKITTRLDLLLAQAILDEERRA